MIVARASQPTRCFTPFRTDEEAENLVEIVFGAKRGEETKKVLLKGDR